MADTSKQIKDLIEATSVNKDDLILVQANDDNCVKVTKETLLKEINQDKTTILNTIGTENMGTTATTLKGAVKELGSQLNENTQQINNVKTDISTNYTKKTDLQITNNNINTQKSRIDTLIQTSSTSFYQKCTSVDTGALLVVASGATTGQINLASVTPLATGYTVVVGDYVRLVYGVASGTAELIDARIGNDGYVFSNVGGNIRDVINTLNNIYVPTDNYFIKSLITFGKIIVGWKDGLYPVSTQDSTLSDSDYGYTDFIEIPDGTTSILRQYFDSNNNAVQLGNKFNRTNFYDSNKIFISGGSYPIIASSIPVNAKYFKENVYIGAINTGVIMFNEKVALNKDEYVPHRKFSIGENYLSKDFVSKIDSMENAISNVTSNGLSGTFLFTGDSICYGAGSAGGYAKIIGDRNPKATVLNYGISGTRVAIKPSQNNSILERIDTMQANANFVILEGGVNDAWDKDIPFGSYLMNSTETTYDPPESAFNTSTFCGALEMMFRKASLKWKDAVIFYLIPHRCDPLATSKYFDTAKILCEKWGVVCIDLRETSGYNIYNTDLKTQYFNNADGVHPNEDGYKRYYINQIEEVLKKYQYRVLQ